MTLVPIDKHEPNSDNPPADRIAAFDRLYRDTFSRVLSYCRRRCRNASEVDDAVSETFLVAWRRLDQVLGADSEIAWLYGVAYRVLSNQRRSIGRRGRLQFRLDRQRPSLLHTDPADTIADDSAVATVYEALGELPAVEQELIRLVAFENLSYVEIAAMTGMRVGSVRSRLYRARRRLEDLTSQYSSRDDLPGPDTDINMPAANPTSGVGEP